MTESPALLSDIEQPLRSILVVEDEVLIRFMIADYLRDCGFVVVEAANADEAVVLLQASGTIIDLVFTDVEMAGSMNGFGLATWVRTHHPGLPVIITSGGAKTADLSEELCALGPIEHKPYDSAALVQRMRKMLEAPTS